MQNDRNTRKRIDEDKGMKKGNRIQIRRNESKIEG